LNKIFQVIGWLAKQHISFIELAVFALLIKNQVVWYIALPAIFASMALSSVIRTVVHERFKSWPVVRK